jgi:hypothetical protein
MTLKTQMQSDVTDVFLDTDEFAGTATISVPGIDDVEWTCVIGSIRAMETFDGNGDTQTIQRRYAYGDTATLIAAGITALRRDIVAKIGCQCWSIELHESLWDEFMVRMSLVLNKIARHQEMEAHASV